MKFYKKTTKPEKPGNHTKAKVITATFIFLLLVAFFGFFAYIFNEYIETHTFTPQTPVIIRTPIIIERVEIVSPLGSPSATLGIAYAAEIENPFNEKSPKGIAWELVKAKWGIQEWGYFEELIQRESTWNPYAVNSSSGACGLGQSLPCAKMGVELWDYEGQLNWIINYIDERYGDPASAVSFHNENNWY